MIMNSEWICLREHLSWKSSFSTKCSRKLDSTSDVDGTTILRELWEYCWIQMGYQWDNEKGIHHQPRIWWKRTCFCGLQKVFFGMILYIKWPQMIVFFLGWFMKIARFTTFYYMGPPSNHRFEDGSRYVSFILDMDQLWDGRKKKTSCVKSQFNSKKTWFRHV